jgi:hypothetical protein
VPGKQWAAFTALAGDLKVDGFKIVQIVRDTYYMGGELVHCGKKYTVHDLRSAKVHDGNRTLLMDDDIAIIVDSVTLVAPTTHAKEYVYG